MPFDIGFIELCVLLVVGLMILGPDKLPVAARQLSKWFGGIRRSINSFTSEMDRELEMDELRRQVEAQKKKIDDALSTSAMNEQNVEKLSVQGSNKSLADESLTDAVNHTNESSSQTSPANLR